MAHMCTVCHPHGKVNLKRMDEHRGRNDAIVGCCYGCACGWWRQIKEKDLPASEHPKPIGGD